MNDIAQSFNFDFTDVSDLAPELADGLKTASKANTMLTDTIVSVVGAAPGPLSAVQIAAVVSRYFSAQEIEVPKLSTVKKYVREAAANGLIGKANRESYVEIVADPSGPVSVEEVDPASGEDPFSGIE